MVNFQLCRSISVIPTAAAYNNKAQAEIKLCNWDSALQDCEKVLDMEPHNVKGKGEHKVDHLWVLLFLAHGQSCC